MSTLFGGSFRASDVADDQFVLVHVSICFCWPLVYIEIDPTLSQSIYHPSSEQHKSQRGQNHIVSRHLRVSKESASYLPVQLAGGLITSTLVLNTSRAAKNKYTSKKKIRDGKQDVQKNIFLAAGKPLGENPDSRLR